MQRHPHTFVDVNCTFVAKQANRPYGNNPDTSRGGIFQALQRTEWGHPKSQFATLGGPIVCTLTAGKDSTTLLLCTCRGVTAPLIVRGPLIEEKAITGDDHLGSYVEPRNWFGLSFLKV